MAPTELTAESSASGNRAGIYLAFLQLVFTLGWTTYVIYLPRLAAQVGIAPSAVILVQLLDQAIFTVTAMGIAARAIAFDVGTDISPRHGRACAGHPRLAGGAKDVDARHKAGHDDGKRCAKAHPYAIALALPPIASRRWLDGSASSSAC